MVKEAGNIRKDVENACKGKCKRKPKKKLQKNILILRMFLITVIFLIMLTVIKFNIYTIKSGESFNNNSVNTDLIKEGI